MSSRPQAWACRRRALGRRRQGAVLVVVIVAVAILGIVIASTVKLAAAQRKMIECRLWQEQADWLVESALERAAARLAAEADYTGETWNVPAQDLLGEASAVVTITVPPDPDAPQPLVVHVAADYPDDPVHRCRRSKQVAVSSIRQEGENP